MNEITREDIIKNGVGAKYLINPEHIERCTSGGTGTHRHHITITEIKQNYLEDREGTYYYTVHRQNGEICGSCTRGGCYEEYTLLPFHEIPEPDGALETLLDITTNTQKYIADIDSQIIASKLIIKQNEELIERLTLSRNKLIKIQ